VNAFAKSCVNQFYCFITVIMPLAGVISFTAPASAGLFTSYAVTIDGSTPDVTDIAIYEKYPPYSSSFTWSFQASGGATTVINNPFPSDVAPASAVLVGIVNGLATDGSNPVDHLVLFLNPDVATTILDQNLSFESLFPGTTEADVIAEYEFVVRTGSGTDEWYQNFFAILGFLNNIQNLTVPDGLGGTTTVNGFFPGATRDTPGAATAIAFTDPQQIGGLTSAIPEPSTFVMAAIGIACGVIARRQRCA
jgi:hypothetical protein